MPEELYGEAFEFLKKDQVLSFEEITRLSKIFISLGVKKIKFVGNLKYFKNEDQITFKEIDSYKCIAAKVDITPPTLCGATIIE